jgi:hypothetical protein
VTERDVTAALLTSGKPTIYPQMLEPEAQCAGDATK